MDPKLKFDMAKDFKLAEQYLTSNNEFRSCGFGEGEVCEEKAYTVDLLKPITNYVSKSWNILYSSDFVPESFSLNDFRRILKENEPLIIQLEYLFRHIPKEETKFNLQLLLSDVDPYLQSDFESEPWYLCFDENTPLAYLAAATVRGRPFILVCTAAAAPLVHLLRKILSESCDEGYDAFGMLLVDNFDGFAKTIRSFLLDAKCVAEFESGCVGVVTESADIDSAVEMLGSPFVQNPWKIKRILVQENVYDLFKNALKWKQQSCPTSEDQPGSVPSDVQSRCGAAFALGGAAFLADYAGSAPPPRAVLLEAYRTNQELLCMLEARAPFGISVWCNDVSIANKIAHKSRVHLVWINDYGYFKGCSDVFYNTISRHASRDFEEFDKQIWRCYSPIDRLSLLSDMRPSNMQGILWCGEAERKYSEVTVDNSGQCVTIKTPLSQISYNSIKQWSKIEDRRLFKILDIMADGDSTLYTTCDVNVPDNVPIVANKNVAISSPLFKCKVIYTRF